MSDSVFSLKSVTNVANSFGFLDMNEKDNEQKYQQIAHFLAGEVEYRIRSIVQEAQLFMKHSKRDVLTTRDINEALKMKSFPTLYGYENFESTHSFFSENVSNFAKSALPRFRKIPTSKPAPNAKNADFLTSSSSKSEKNAEENIYFLEDYEVDLFDFLKHKSDADVQEAQKRAEMEKQAEEKETTTTTEQAPAPTVNVKDTLSLPISPFVLSHWLAISGIQPIIPQNPLILRNSSNMTPENPPFGELFDKDEIDAIKSEKNAQKDKNLSENEKKKRRTENFSRFGELESSDLKMKGEDEIFENNENVEVKPLVKHVLSKELQMYYNRVISMFFGSNSLILQSQQDFATKQEKILNSLRKDASIGQLVPYFTRFISYFVMNCFSNLANATKDAGADDKDKKKDLNEELAKTEEQHDAKFVDEILQQLNLIMEVTRALLMNNNIQIELYLHQLLPPILSCLLSKRVSVSKFSNHWKLRTAAAEILGILVSKYGNSFQTLIPRLTETLVSAFLNPKNLTVAENLPTTFGALKGILLALGNQVANLYLLEPKQNSNLKVFLTMLFEKYFNIEFEGYLKNYYLDAEGDQDEDQEMKDNDDNSKEFSERKARDISFEEFFIRKLEAFQIYSVCQEFFINYFSNLRNKILISKFSDEETEKILKENSKIEVSSIQSKKDEKKEEIVEILKKRLMSSSLSVLVNWDDVSGRYQEISDMIGDSVLPAITYGAMLNPSNNSGREADCSRLADAIVL